MTKNAQELAFMVLEQAHLDGTLEPAIAAKLEKLVESETRPKMKQILKGSPKRRAVPCSLGESIVLNELFEMGDEIQPQKIMLRISGNPAKVGCSVSSVPVFLSRLESSGLVSSRKIGKHRMYTLTEKGRSLVQSLRKFTED